jgi:hypothetical protein
MAFSAQKDWLAIFDVVYGHGDTIGGDHPLINMLRSGRERNLVSDVVEEHGMKKAIYLLSVTTDLPALALCCRALKFEALKKREIDPEWSPCCLVSRQGVPPCVYVDTGLPRGSIDPLMIYINRMVDGSWFLDANATIDISCLHRHIDACIWRQPLEDNDTLLSMVDGYLELHFELFDEDGCYMDRADFVAKLSAK